MTRALPKFAVVTLVALIAVACDITQAHIDEASDRLAEATVASGSMPTVAQVAAGSTLQSTHLAGSSWRWINRGDWPNAYAVVTLGSNGRLVWHVESSGDLDNTKFWRVSTAGIFAISADNQYWREANGSGVTVDQNTVCLPLGDQSCALIMQRVTP